MKRATKTRLLGLATVLGLLVSLQAAPAAAAPLSYPNGPWVVPDQEVSFESIRNYDQLVATVASIAQSSRGAVTLEYAPFPAKGSGRLIPYAVIGSGPRKMIVVAQQHGGEYMVSNGAIDLIRDLSSNSKLARFVRDELTLIIVPRVNIDGFDDTTTGSPWRYNVDPDVCPTGTCPPFYGRNQGYDINRYHPYLTDYPFDNPNTTAPDDSNPVPESLNCRAIYDMAGGSDAVELVIDLHHQATPLDANRDMVNGSTLWPTATATANSLGIREQFDEAAYLSKQVVSTLLDAMDKIAHANFSLYNGGPEPGISRNAYGLLGSASVLMEHRSVGQKAGGYLSDIPRRSVMAVIEALADGSLYDADIVRAEALQRAPNSASLFWKCVVARPYTLENYNFCREKYDMNPVTRLPTFPYPDAHPGPGEVIDEETASQLLYELETE